MQELNIDPSEIDYVVLSHQHQDHTGGLFEFLKKNNKAEVFVLDSFSDQFKDKVQKNAAKMNEVRENVKISNGIYATGIVQGNPDEQSLVVETNKGLVVIVGCSHPGVDKILAEAKKQGNVHTIIGGFHGFSDFDKLEGIEIIGACHCTEHMSEIKKRFPKQFREIKSGDVIEIK